MNTRGGAGIVGGLMAASILDKSRALSVARVMVLVGSLGGAPPASLTKLLSCGFQVYLMRSQLRM